MTLPIITAKQYKRVVPCLISFQREQNILSGAGWLVRTNHLDLLDARHVSRCSTLLCIPIPGTIDAALMSADADLAGTAKGVVAFGLPDSFAISER
jgi:hypothetical protein